MKKIELQNGFWDNVENELIDDIRNGIDSQLYREIYYELGNGFNYDEAMNGLNLEITNNNGAELIIRF